MKPINFMGWINDHRHLLRPPVGNQEIWHDREFMVTVVGGPNSRRDFHINEGEEFFYQLEGTLNLRILQNGRPEDMPIGPGEIFLLPAKVPHSPQRPAGSVGLVLERRRRPGERDGFVWICERCHQPLYEEFLPIESLVDDLPPVFARYYGNPAHLRCPACGHQHTRPEAS